MHTLLKFIDNEPVLVHNANQATQIVRALKSANLIPDSFNEQTIKRKLFIIARDYIRESYTKILLYNNGRLTASLDKKKYPKYNTYLNADLLMNDINSYKSQL